MAKATINFKLVSKKEKKVNKVHRTIYTYKGAGETVTFRTGKAAWTLELVKGHPNIGQPIMKAFDAVNGLWDTPEELKVNFNY